MENEPVIELYWEKYKPNSFQTMIGNEDFKKAFQHKRIEEYINLILAGPPGTGKSLGVDLIDACAFKRNSKTWNMSMEGTVDTVGTSVLKFCDEGSLDGVPRKLAVFQEADRMSKPSQEAMRVPMEKYAQNVVFALTVNYVHKIIDPIQSRCCIIKFELASDDQLLEFADRILKGEQIDFKPSQLEAIIKNSRGQFRKVANTLQGWTTGKNLYFKDTKQLDEKIEHVFDLLIGMKLNEMIAAVEKMMSEYNTDNIIIRLTEKIKEESSMPQVLKAKCINACASCLEKVVIGIDNYVSIYNLCSDLVLVVDSMKRRSVK